jgi:predicted RNA-binding Zn-ribbon protein involved in translation (DUF1610 family)
MSSDSLKRKTDRRQGPNRRLRSRGGRRLEDLSHKAVRFLCPECGNETVEALESEDGYNRYGCQVCGRKW